MYLRHYKEDRQTAKMLADSRYSNLLSSHFQPLSSELSEWMNAPYETNEKYEEQLIHRTISGGYVRSKSETILLMFLTLYKIPFRYECKLELGDVTLYPDFTIRHPRTGEYF